MRQKWEKRVFFFKSERAKGIIEIQFNKYLLSVYQAVGPGLSTKMSEALIGRHSGEEWEDKFNNKKVD